MMEQKEKLNKEQVNKEMINSMDKAKKMFPATVTEKENMNINKIKFRGLCLEVLPLIDKIIETVKKNGYETMSTLTMGKDGYFSFDVHNTGWSMIQVGNGPVKMRYEYSEEIPLHKKKAYTRVSENLVEISLVYASMKTEYEELNNIDSIAWKQMFVQWANEFEVKYSESEHWADNDYLERIEKFARHKILEFAGLDRY